MTFSTFAEMPVEGLVTVDVVIVATLQGAALPAGGRTFVTDALVMTGVTGVVVAVVLAKTATPFSPSPTARAGDA